jgi:hypothetical protein
MVSSSCPSSNLAGARSAVELAPPAGRGRALVENVASRGKKLLSAETGAATAAARLQIAIDAGVTRPAAWGGARRFPSGNVR